MTSAVEDPTEGWWLEEFQLVRLRPDGSRIEVQEVADHLERLRVPAHVVDGDANGNPALILISVALTDTFDDGASDGYPISHIVRADDTLTAPLEILDLTRSVLHHFRTIAIVDSGNLVIDELGHSYPVDNLSDEVEGQMGLVPERFGPAVLHMVSTLDPMNPAMTAKTANFPVDVVHMDGVSVIRDPSGRSDAEVTELALKSELPAISICRSADAFRIDGAVRVGRKKASFCMLSGNRGGVLVGVGTNETLRNFLSLEPELQSTSRTDIPADLHQALTAASHDPDLVVERVLTALGLPVEAGKWLEEETPPCEVTVVEPQSWAKVFGSTFKDPEITKDLEGMRFYGRIFRFFRRHPLIGLIVGVIELVIAGLFLTVAREWGLSTWLCWLFAILWGLDGITHLTMAIPRLRNKRPSTY